MQPPIGVGHIAAVAIEQYPNTFAGALPVCGAIGDYALFDYFLDFNLAAQQLGTGNSGFPVVDAEFGCAFTDGPHTFGTACP